MSTIQRIAVFLFGLFCGLLLGYMLSYSSSVNTLSNKPKPTITLTWKKNTEETIFKNDQILVGTDGRIYAEIEKDSGIWYVWHNGAGFGEYADEQPAKKRAEEVAKRLGINTH